MLTCDFKYVIISVCSAYGFDKKIATWLVLVCQVAIGIKAMALLAVAVVLDVILMALKKMLPVTTQARP
ncbi:hypothetical protein L2E82_02104 [Cichorium intybus]|uniref:Uncharacterized protein n=1 Tax=Cichorium intybus TaxID=13427 RepID=A0ACB9H220_CICIN|nr:hypothetical protein L2E82_02104 [Cichorium intybus]